jgi:D-alanyl-D-alanine carboxypeptidase/D-alanyl-D-alanine-endopeptidase (penicillin-binding protein 4)
MTSHVAGSGSDSAPRRLLAVLLAVLSFAACRTRPPQIVPPAPSSTKIAELQREIGAIVALPALEHATWGIAVKSLATAETLVAINPRKLLTPASSMKLVTLAAAADRLGWDYRYKTRFLMAGKVEDGVLEGEARQRPFSTAGRDCSRSEVYAACAAA